MKSKITLTRTIAHVLGNMVAIDVFMICVYWAASAASNHTPGRPEVVLLAAILGVHWVWCIHIAVRQYQTLAFVDALEDDLQLADCAKEKVLDPWAMQRSLMAASGQPLPVFPVINKAGVLYAALLLEELGETFDGLLHALNAGAEAKPRVHGNEILIRIIIGQQAESMGAASKRLREILAYTPDFEYPLSLKDAVEILDGTTDVAVVNSGFALACGLPGASAYAEVALSNLSKANPATGVIDKTLDGKWIKGREFFKPDLVKVIHSNFPSSNHD